MVNLVNDVDADNIDGALGLGLLDNFYDASL